MSFPVYHISKLYCLFLTLFGNSQTERHYLLSAQCISDVQCVTLKNQYCAAVSFNSHKIYRSSTITAVQNVFDVQ